MCGPECKYNVYKACEDPILMRALSYEVDYEAQNIYLAEQTVQS